MAQYFTDFSEYTAGSAPDDWSAWATGVISDLQIANDGSKNYLIKQVAASDRHAFSWNEIPNTVDGEIVYEWSRNFGEESVEQRAAYRIDETKNTSSGTATFTSTGPRASGGGTLVWTYVDGSFTQHATLSGSWSFDTIYRTRVQFTGTGHKVRTWLASDPEPTSWDVETTFSQLSTLAGRIGFGGTGGADPHNIYFLGVGTNGDPAPTEAPGGAVTGSGDQNLPKTQQSASGTSLLNASGEASQALPSVSQSATGTQANSGSAGQTLPALSQSAEGQLGEDATGTAAQTLPATTQTASGTQTHTGAATQTLPAATQSASGQTGEDVSGAAAQTLPGISQAGMARQAFSGSAASVLPVLVQAAIGRLAFEATIAQQLPAAQQQGVGAASYTGAANQTLGAISSNADAELVFAGESAQVLPFPSQQATGYTDVEGQAAQTLSSMRQSALGIGGEIEPGSFGVLYRRRRRA